MAQLSCEICYNLQDSLVDLPVQEAARRYLISALNLFSTQGQTPVGVQLNINESFPNSAELTANMSRLALEYQLQGQLVQGPSASPSFTLRIQGQNPWPPLRPLQSGDLVAVTGCSSEICYKPRWEQAQSLFDTAALSTLQWIDKCLGASWEHLLKQQDPNLEFIGPWSSETCQGELLITLNSQMWEESVILDLSKKDLIHIVGEIL